MGDFTIGNYGTAPWLQPTGFVPSWDSFGWNNNFGWGSVWNTPSTNNSSSTPKTYEERKAAAEEAQEKYFEKLGVLRTQKKEIDDQISAAQKQKEEAIAEQFGQGAVIKTQNDGSVKVEPKLEKMSFWQKLGRGAMQALKGITNIGKSLIGIDAEGKWHPWKCLRNVGIAVSVAALCVFAAPLGAAAASALASAGVGAAAAGAVGTAIATVPTALAYTGLATGAYQAGKGVYQATQADTIEEFDEAYQNIGSGVFIGAASAAGLKSIARTAGVASTAGGIKGAAADVFVNSWKAGAVNMSRAQSVSALAGGGWEGFKASCADARLAGARYKESEFQKAYDAKVTELETKISTLEGKIATSNGSEKAMFEIEHEALMRDYIDLSSAKNKFDFKSLGSDSKDYLSELSDKTGRKSFSLKDIKNIFNAKKEVEINGYTFKGSELKMLQAKIGELTKGGKDLSNISKLKFKSVYAHAGKISDSSVENFGFSNKSFSIGNWWQTQRANASLFKIGTDVAFTAMDPAYMAASFTKGNIGVMPLYADAGIFNPVIDKSESSTTVSKADWDSSFAQIDAGIEQLTAQSKAIQKQIDSLG